MPAATDQLHEIPTLYGSARAPAAEQAARLLMLRAAPRRAEPGPAPRARVGSLHTAHTAVGPPRVDAGTCSRQQVGLRPRDSGGCTCAGARRGSASTASATTATTPFRGARRRRQCRRFQFPLPALGCQRNRPRFRQVIRASRNVCGFHAELQLRCDGVRERLHARPFFAEFLHGCS